MKRDIEKIANITALLGVVIDLSTVLPGAVEGVVGAVGALVAALTAPFISLKGLFGKKG